MQPPFEVTPEILDAHIDKLLDVIDEITKPENQHKLTVMVGQNGTGKSLVRKQVDVKLITKLNKERHIVREISMQMRTETRSSLGALCSIMHDSPDAPTSTETWKLLRESMGRRTFTLDEPYFLVLDEMEIGMSQESVMGILNYFKSQLPTWLDNTLGILVITHSPIVAKELCEIKDCQFFDLGYNEVNQDIHKWLNRTIVPTDFEWLNHWSLELYRKINDRSNPIGP